MMYSIFVYIVIGLIIGSIWWYLTIPSNLPPGPRGLPLLGSVFDTWRATVAPRKLQQWARIYGPLYKFYIAEKLVVVLGDLNVMRDALITQGDVFSGRPRFYMGGNDITGNGLVHADGERQKIQRRFALSTLRDFGFGRSMLEPIIHEQCKRLIKEIHDHGQAAFEPTTLLLIFVNGVIYSMLFGQAPDEDVERTKEAIAFLRARSPTETTLSDLTPFSISERTQWIRSSLMNMMAALLRLRSQNPSAGIADKYVAYVRNGIAVALKDFDEERDEPVNYVQACRKAQHEEENKVSSSDSSNSSFTDSQLSRNVMDIFAAGTGTTADTLSCAIFYMAHNQDIQERVYEEIKRETAADNNGLLNYAVDRKKLPFTEAVIMEVQRMNNLLPLGVFHKTLADCKLRGYDIPAGAVVVPLMTAALRDPNAYPNPEVFDPTRFFTNERKNGGGGGGNGLEASHFIPFSIGKRSCLGESLAKMELFHFFTALITHFKFIFPIDKQTPPVADWKRANGRNPYTVCAIPRGNGEYL